MLLMNKSGRVYDVPDTISEKFIVTSWNASSASLKDFLCSSNEASPSTTNELDCGCCCVYSNYCPNK